MSRARGAGSISPAAPAPCRRPSPTAACPASSPTIRGDQGHFPSISPCLLHRPWKARHLLPRPQVPDLRARNAQKRSETLDGCDRDALCRETKGREKPRSQHCGSAAKGEGGKSCCTRRRQREEEIIIEAKRRGGERRGEERGAGIAVARSRHSGWPRTPAPAPCSGRALPQQRGQTRGEGRRRGDERKEEMRGGGKEKKSFLPRLLRPRLPESIIFGREETGRRGERRDEGREERQ